MVTQNFELSFVKLYKISSVLLNSSKIKLLKLNNDTVTETSLIDTPNVGKLDKIHPFLLDF